MQPGNPLPGTSWGNEDIYPEKDLYTNIYSSNYMHKEKYASTGEWINKSWYRHTIKYCLTIKEPVLITPNKAES